MITILPANNKDSITAASINLFVLGLELIFLNPEKTSHLNTLKISVRVFLVLLSLQIIALFIKKLNMFYPFLIIQASLYLLFRATSYSDKKRSIISQELRSWFNLEKDNGDKRKEIIRNLRGLLEYRILYRNTIFKSLWALLSVTVFPGIIGLMSIYSSQIKEWLRNGWPIVMVGLTLTIIFFFLLLTRPLFEIINISQYIFVPDERVLTQTIELLKEQKQSTE